MKNRAGIEDLFARHGDDENLPKMRELNERFLKAQQELLARIDRQAQAGTVGTTTGAGATGARPALAAAPRKPATIH